MPFRKAIVQRNNALVEEDLPLPSLEKTQVLVKVIASSLNPTDVQSFDGDAFGDGAVLGCDFAGIIEEIGSSVTQLKRGDKIAALIWGGEIEGLGAYSTYCVAEEGICFKIPSGLDYASASTVPLAANTAWLALFSKDCLNIPRTGSSGISLLVWGGSSTVGAYAIQIARMHGFNIVTTCSPQNFDVVKKHGARHVFDYNDPNVVQKIAEAVPNLAYAFDCIGNETSSTMSAEAMSAKEDGVICTVRPGKAFTENVPENVKVTDVLVFTAFLKPHVYKKVYKWPTQHEDHALSREMYEKIGGWFQNGEMTPQTPKDMGVLSVKSLEEAMEWNRRGKVSNEKLCFQVADM
ncbi:GroES-like protein [Cadophora sp. DSE1049]|nr:GroES-like protein [Cadophora sp. DSE1049]